MLEDRIRTIEERIRAAQNIPESTRADLLEQLATLEAELKNVPPDALPAPTPSSRPDVLEAAVNDLTSTVEGMEASHPVLAATVNRLAVALSNMGI